MVKELLYPFWISQDEDEVGEEIPEEGAGEETGETPETPETPDEELDETGTEETDEDLGE